MKSNFILAIALISLTTLTSCQKKTFMRKEFLREVSQDISITLNTNYRDIFLKNSDANELKIEYFENKTEYYNLNLDESNNLAMVLIKESSGFATENREEQIITMYIPTSISINSLNIVNASGDVYLEDNLCFKDGIVDINNGNLSLENISFESSFEIITKNGKVNGTINEALEDVNVTIEEKKSNINIKENASGSKLLSINSNNSDINVLFSSEQDSL